MAITVLGTPNATLHQFTAVRSPAAPPPCGRGASQGGSGNGKEAAPLKMYDLRWIVTQILGGLEAGYGFASRKVEKDSQGRSWGDDFDDEVVMGKYCISFFVG